MALPVHDLDGLEGDWHLEGEILGRPLVQEVVVEWVLGGAYIRMHYLPSTVTPLTDEPYEAVAYIGWNPEGQGHIVMFLFDTFGAAYSSPGVGSALDGGGVRFGFDYPQGGFVTDLIPTDDGWRIEQFSQEESRLVPFGVKHLSRTQEGRFPIP
jgi:hypothetical protein